jgi:hypothetical protein
MHACGDHRGRDRHASTRLGTPESGRDGLVGKALYMNAVHRDWRMILSLYISLVDTHETCMIHRTYHMATTNPSLSLPLNLFFGTVFRLPNR